MRLSLRRTVFKLVNEIPWNCGYFREGANQRAGDFPKVSHSAPESVAPRGWQDSAFLDVIFMHNRTRIVTLFPTVLGLHAVPLVAPHLPAPDGETSGPTTRERIHRPN